MAVAVQVLAVVVVVAGVAKLRHPLPARRLLAGLGWNVPAWTVRVLGAGEVGIALAVLGVGGVWSTAAVAVLHVGFAVVAGAAARLGDVGCGCFGSTSDVPPGPAHVIANAVSAVICAVAAFDPVPGLIDAVPAGAAGLAHLLVVATGAGLVIASYTDAAELSHRVRVSARTRTGAEVTP